MPWNKYKLWTTKCSCLCNCESVRRACACQIIQMEEHFRICSVCNWTFSRNKQHEKLLSYEIVLSLSLSIFYLFLDSALLSFFPSFSRYLGLFFFALWLLIDLNITLPPTIAPIKSTNWLFNYVLSASDEYNREINKLLAWRKFSHTFRLS